MRVHPLDVALDHGIHGRFAEGEAVLRTIIDDPRAQFNLGWYLCRQGRWSEAAVCLDTGRILNCYGSPPLRNGRPIWNEHPLDGKTLHLRCEGGFGDEVIGVRWARNFAALGARVHVSCSPGLASLFARAPGVTAVTSFVGADHVHCDYWMPAMSCARWFQPDGRVPYLNVDPFKDKAWKEFLDCEKVKIGFKWAGNPKFEGEQHRKFPVKHMLKLTREFPNVQFYSLQVGNDLIDLPPHVVDLGPELKDWDDTAAAVSNMDLVVTSCTGVAHCAAAIGVPTWVVVPVMPYYLWAAPGDGSAWYDSVRLFRQQEFGNWDHPFDAVTEALCRGDHVARIEGLRHAG